VSPTPELRWTTGQVDSGGERIYYEVTAAEDLPADAPTVVLGHGGAGSHAVWFQQVPVLARRRRVVTWDTRGFGRSSFVTGRLDGPTSAGDLAAVLDGAGVDGPVHLVGQSMGGWWITAFATAFPGRVRSLTYTNTAGGVHTDELDAHFATVGERVRTEPVLGRHFAVSRHLVERNPARAFLYQQLNTLQDPPPAAVAAAVTARTAPAAIRALALATLVIGSTEDGLFPPDLLRQLAERLDARFALLENAGHSAYFETPEAWNAAYTEFLDAVDRPL
jgi:pimeloyl-ACP methyl ester carboxylesterase